MYPRTMPIGFGALVAVVVLLAVALITGATGVALVAFGEPALKGVGLGLVAIAVASVTSGLWIATRQPRQPADRHSDAEAP